MSTTSLVVPLGRQGPGRLSADAVARLELALRQRAGGVLAGDHRTAGLGDATELAQLRPYEAGDDVRRLDPAASARTAIPHVRLHVPERAVTTWLVLDVSASMAFGTGERLKSDVAEGVAEVVTRLAVRRGGRIAVTTAGAEEPRLLRPQAGRGALATVRSLVREGVTPDGAAAPTEPAGLAAALTRVSRLARARGIVVVVSDFRDEGWRSPLRRLAARHGVLAVEVLDPREGELLDAGTLVLVDPETGEEVEVDTGSPQLREAFAAAEAERRAAVATELRRAGADRVVLGAERDWLRDLGRGLR
ncbi:MAG: hypothetical protein QOD81_1273 [Solirubrobacteraceae bacterium]|jgi:uncharacterized protein (DUF58 family)|nr:hypothetical protein [Solirubrobacteraceae bacterium]